MSNKLDLCFYHDKEACVSLLLLLDYTQSLRRRTLDINESWATGLRWKNECFSHSMTCLNNFRQLPLFLSWSVHCSSHVILFQVFPSNRTVNRWSRHYPHGRENTKCTIPGQFPVECNSRMILLHHRNQLEEHWTHSIHAGDRQRDLQKINDTYLKTTILLNMN